MAATPLCILAGRVEDPKTIADTLEASLDLAGAHFFDEDTLVKEFSEKGYGVLRADSYACRDITDFAISFDSTTNLCVVSTLSPSLIPRSGNQSPLVGSVLPFAADLMEDPTFAYFLVLDDTIREHRPIEGFMAKAAGLTGEKFVIQDSMIKVNPDDPFIPATIEGMKSFGQFAIPYLKELKDTSIDSSADGTIDALISMLQKLKSTPVEMDAMLDLEYGPVFEYYWMAYSALMEAENRVDRALASLYAGKQARRLTVTSGFQTEHVIFSDTDIPGLVERHREYLTGKMDLTKIDVLSRM